jgi:DNA gyrase subunit A
MAKVSKKAKPSIPIEVKTSDVVEDSMTEYAIYSLEERHIPDFRDGLKPVHRRTIWAMYEDGTLWDGRFTKCAAVVGNTIARYHPHGDTACYGALVTLTGQPLKKSKKLFTGSNNPYPHIEGYGNFGAIDTKDPQKPDFAAMRYPECRLSILSKFLFNLKPTTEFVPNYDNRRKEPLFLPASFPFLLLNGITGIAVGASTDFPPHNLGEVCDALILFLKSDSPPSLKKIMKKIKGPDFPFGGTLIDKEQIIEAYKTGTGSISWGLNTDVSKKGKRWIIRLTGIPWRFNLKKYLIKLDNEKDVKGIRKLEISDKLDIEIVVASEKMMKKIVEKTNSTKNNWNVTHRKSGKEVDFKGVNLRSYLIMWVDYCIDTHKKYFKIEIKRVQGEIAIDLLKLLAIKHGGKVISYIKEENFKSIKKLLKTDDDGVQIVKSMSVGAFTKTNETAIKKRVKNKKEELAQLKNNLRNLKDYLVKFFQSLKEYSHPRKTVVL